MSIRQSPGPEERFSPLFGSFKALCFTCKSLAHYELVLHKVNALLISAYGHPITPVPFVEIWM
jgi:hypothetical protein